MGVSLLRNTVDDTNTDRNRDVQKYVKPYKMYSHSSSEPVNVQLMEMLFIKFKCQLFVCAFFLFF